MLGWLFGSRVAGAVEHGKVTAAVARDAMLRMSALALESILFAFAATTAIAAGFVSALGLDAMTLIGKWAILSAVLFYTSTLWALMSPLMALPRSMQAIADQSRNAASQKSAENSKKRDALRLARVEWDAAQSSLPDWLRSSGKLAAEAQRRQTYERLQAQAVTEGWAEATEAANASTNSTADLLRRASYAMYAALVALLVVWTVGLPFGAIFVVAMFGLTVLGRKVGLAAVFPLASVVLLFYGHVLARVVVDLEPTATLVLKDGGREPPTKARILLNASEDILIVQHDGDKRILSLVPKAAIARISIRAVPVTGAWAPGTWVPRWLAQR